MFTRLAILFLLPLCVSAAPNIVFMVADDLGWNDVGYNGSEIRTPNVDSIAHEGIVLDRYYTYPLCSPTRVAIMTGRSAIRQGIDSPIGPNGGMPLDEHLLPETLRASGYQTFQVGKWHLGMERIASHPYRRGFDHSYGHLGPSIDYFTHIWSGGLDWHRNGEIVREEGYSTELIADEAVSLIRKRDKSRPMFLYVAFNAPHAPQQAPDSYLDRFPEITNQSRRVYAAMVSALDDGVGRILQAVDAQGIAAETLVVWTSDNGGSPRVGASNEPFRGGKSGVFEGGIRVPGVARWPGVLESGSKLDQQITAHDWFQTLTSAAGVERHNVKPLDGVDMWPALKDGTLVERGEVVIGVDGNYAIFRDGWKFVESTPRGGTRSTTHLYRILDDPYEEHDLIEVQPERAADLLARIRSVPRPPSVSRDVVPEGGPAAPQRGKRAPAGKRAKAGGPGRGAALNGWPEETRSPWIERAIRD